MPEFTEFPIPRKDVEDLTSQQQEDVRVALGLPAVTQAEAEAGTEPESRTFSPLRVRQAVFASGRDPSYRAVFPCPVSGVTGAATLTQSDLGAAISGASGTASTAWLRWMSSSASVDAVIGAKGIALRPGFNRVGMLTCAYTATAFTDTAAVWQLGYGFRNTSTGSSLSFESADTLWAVGFRALNNVMFAAIRRPDESVDYYDLGAGALGNYATIELAVTWDGLGAVAWMWRRDGAWQVGHTIGDGPNGVDQSMNNQNVIASYYSRSDEGNFAARLGSVRLFLA